MGKNYYTALGLMSGTSLDGVDAAIITTNGEKIKSFGPVHYLDYNRTQKARLTKATREALKWKFQGQRPSRLETAEKLIDNIHINVSKAMLHDYRCDLIGYHGQTVVHQPPQQGLPGKTLQLGNGQKLANATQIPVVYDFRTADMEAGGEGAPLAPIYHKALCEYSKLKGDVLVLNLGGVGNFTLVGKSGLVASDTGPANGPLDSWLQKHGHEYDKGGAISSKGQVDLPLVGSWLRGIDFFKKRGPKSADRYDFDVIADLESKSLEDGAATLVTFCAASVKHSLLKMALEPDYIVVCGGGRKNAHIMHMLQKLIECKVSTAEDVGWIGDAIEAQACAFFAVRSNMGLPLSFPQTTGVLKPIVGGRLVYPE